MATIVTCAKDHPTLWYAEKDSGHVHRAQRGGMDVRYDERFNARDWERNTSCKLWGADGVCSYVSVRPTGAAVSFAIGDVRW